MTEARPRLRRGTLACLLVLFAAVACSAKADESPAIPKSHLGSGGSTSVASTTTSSDDGAGGASSGAGGSSKGSGGTTATGAGGSSTTRGSGGSTGTSGTSTGSGSGGSTKDAGGSSPSAEAGTSPGTPGVCDWTRETGACASVDCAASCTPPDSQYSNYCQTTCAALISCVQTKSCSTAADPLCVIPSGTAATPNVCTTEGDQASVDRSSGKPSKTTENGPGLAAWNLIQCICSYGSTL